MRSWVGWMYLSTRKCRRDCGRSIIGTVRLSLQTRRSACSSSRDVHYSIISRTLSALPSQRTSSTLSYGSIGDRTGRARRIWSVFSFASREQHALMQPELRLVQCVVVAGREQPGKVRGVGVGVGVGHTAVRKAYSLERGWSRRSRLEGRCGTMTR